MDRTMAIGRIVHYVMPNGMHRPAIVVRVWTLTCVNLQVFVDGSNYQRETGITPEEAQRGIAWRTSATEDTAGAFATATWHWPE